MAYGHALCPNIRCIHMKNILVKLGKRSYDITVCHDSMDKLGKLLKKLNIGTDAVIITNPTIKRLFGKIVEETLLSSGFKVRFETVPDSEKAKSEKYCLKLINNISRFDGTGRRIFIIALGGGVIGDLSGFVASIYKRGVPYVQVPTTLLAQVDSSIGGKVAIDLAVGKNLAGSFYQPRLVFSDVNTLKSLSRNDLTSGMAEVVKYGIIRSPKLFTFLEKNYSKILKGEKKALQSIIYTCCAIKAGVVEKDELDNKGLRVILNLGHTIGHAIETAAHYRKAYSHGQAVALGIIAASSIAEKIGMSDKDTGVRIKKLLRNIGLPVKMKGLKVKDIISAQARDKKFIHGKNRFVLPVKIGKVIIKEDIPMPVIKDSISALFS